MSWYYSYYIGLENKETKQIIPFGIYDCFGKLIPVINNSRSFASDITDYFWNLPEEKISEELRKEFEYENWEGKKIVDLRWAYLNELPSENYIVTGYFLKEGIEEWEKNHDDTLFYNVISPHIYAELMKKELVFGKNKPEKDIEGVEYTEPNASDYIYSAIPNIHSKEYDSFLIHSVANILFINNCDIVEKYNVVVIESQG